MGQGAAAAVAAEGNIPVNSEPVEPPEIKKKLSHLQFITRISVPELLGFWAFLALLWRITKISYLAFFKQTSYMDPRILAEMVD